jgi:hypothetical protein
MALWAMLESATYSWKPLSFAFEPSEPFPYVRYANPMLMQVAFLLALLALSKSVLKPARAGLAGFALAAAAMATTFYTQVFYWSLLGALIAVFCALSLIQGVRRQAAVAAGLGAAALLLGLPALVQGFGATRSPDMLDAIHRVGYMIRNRVPHFAFHKALLVTFVAYQLACWRNRDAKWRLGTAGMIAGYLCLNQNALTGISNQDHHYFRPMMAIYLFVAADFVARIAERARRTAFARAVPALGLLLVFGVLAKSAWIATAWSREAGPLASMGSLSQTMKALREIRPSERGPILADPQLAYALALSGDSSPYVFEYMHHCILPDHRLFLRWAVLFKSRGLTPSQHRGWLERFAGTTTLPWWLYGLPENYSYPKDSYSAEGFRHRIDASASAYAARPLEAFAAEGARSNDLPRYALETPSFALDLEALRSAFEVRLERELPAEGTRLWSLVPKARPAR